MSTEGYRSIKGIEGLVRAVDYHRIMSASLAEEPFKVAWDDINGWFVVGPDRDTHISLTTYWPEGDEAPSHAFIPLSGPVADELRRLLGGAE